MAPTSSAPAFEARQIMRGARHAALATLDRDSGAPFASLVAASTTIDGAPGVLISTLARHTVNLARDARASLLFQSGPDEGDDILAAGRVTVSGRLLATGDDDFRRRFLARHPASTDYAGFADFAFYLMEVEMAHYVGGFGRIRSLPAAEFLLDSAAARAIGQIEADAAAHMNADHPETVRLYATALLGAEKGDWRVAGCDPEGADLVCDNALRRLPFDQPVADTGGLREAFAALAAKARARQGD